MRAIVELEVLQILIICFIKGFPYLAAVTVMAVSSIAPAIASGGQVDGSINGGSVNLDELDERNPSAVQSVDGGNGIWTYGVGAVYVYSYHSNTVNNPSATARGIKEDRDSQYAGIRAEAEAVKNPLGGNRAYWGTWQ